MAQVSSIYLLQNIFRCRMSLIFSAIFLNKYKIRVFFLKTNKKQFTYFLKMIEGLVLEKVKEKYSQCNW